MLKPWFSKWKCHKDNKSCIFLPCLSYMTILIKKTDSYNTHRDVIKWLMMRFLGVYRLTQPYFLCTVEEFQLDFFPVFTLKLILEVSGLSTVCLFMCVMIEQMSAKGAKKMAHWNFQCFRDMSEHNRLYTRTLCACNSGPPRVHCFSGSVFTELLGTVVQV